MGVLQDSLKAAGDGHSAMVATSRARSKQADAGGALTMTSGIQGQAFGSEARARTQYGTFRHWVPALVEDWALLRR